MLSIAVKLKQQAFKMSKRNLNRKSGFWNRVFPDFNIDIGSIGNMNKTCLIDRCFAVASKYYRFCICFVVYIRRFKNTQLFLNFSSMPFRETAKVSFVSKL